MKKIIKNAKNIIWILAIFTLLGFYNETQAFTCGTDTVVGRSPDTTTYQTVLGADGNCWLKSNLGTANVATAHNDSSAYGWLYQWGRLTDGHQITTSSTTATNATTDTPGHANFITETTIPIDWRVPQNDNLWQGASGINSPCPAGWRLPTSTEWQTEVTAAGITNYTTAFNSSLKLTAAGYRNYNPATLTNQGSNGSYWSSSSSGGSTTFSLFLHSGGVSSASAYYRAVGYSVRCIKDMAIVTTQSATSISATVATGNGNVAATGGENPTRGMQWGTAPGTYPNSCSAGTGPTGAFSCAIAGLSPNTTYYVKAYATNSSGTSYGAETSFSTTNTTFTCGTSTVTGLSPDTTTYQTVLGADGNCWLKSNLGTANVATSFNDSAAYGWLYQWGRGTDGHQIRTSTTTATNAATDTAGHANFITESTSPYDWRVPQNDNLWQGVNGINNPCPAGWRLPTQTEWATLANAASISNYTTAYNSSLKLTIGGSRSYNGTLSGVGVQGNYWSSAGTSNYIKSFYFSSSEADTGIDNRHGIGNSVRCIKDNPIVTSTITTQTPTSITSTTATGNGNVTATGGANPTRSIEWGTVSGTYPSSCTAGSGGTGTFTCSMTTLSPNTTYYARAKAVNTAGTSYGSEVSFTTATLPVITITNPNTTPAQSKTITASTNKGNLTQSTTTGSLCDNSLTFTTYASTTFSSEADNTKKICYRSIDATSGTTYTMSNAISGIDTTNPTINSVTSNCQNTTDPNFIIDSTDTTSGLDPNPYSFDGGSTWQSQNNKTFYDFNHTIPTNNIQVKDNAGNIATYTDSITQVCLAAATVTTEPTTDITLNSATLNANITNAGSSNPERQIEYGTQTNTYPNSCTQGTGSTGAYSCNLTNLLPDTTYYYRAKATNSAGTSYGTEQSFQTLPDYITITDPTPVKMSNAVSSGQVTLSSGTASSTPLVTTNTNIHIQDTVVRMVIPQNTQITNTDSGNFNFQNFITEAANVKATIPNSLSAVKVGVPNTKLTFSQPITLTIDVSPAYNGRTLEVLYQNDGESTWHSQTSCTITGGQCIFQTNHATTYTVNGSGNMVGDTGVNLNTDIQEVISLDCGTSIVNMGNLTPGTPVTGSSTCLTTTNANGGYNLSVQRDDSTDTTMDKTTEDSTNITDKPNWNPTIPNAQTWSGTGLGFTVYDSTANKNTTWWGTGNSINDSNNLYAGFSPTQTDIMRYTTYSNLGTTTSIGYKLDVPPSQKSGAYSGAITYQVVTTP